MDCGRAVAHHPQLFDEYARPKPLQARAAPGPLAHLFKRRDSGLRKVKRAAALSTELRGPARPLTVATWLVRSSRTTPRPSNRRKTDDAREVGAICRDRSDRVGIDSGFLHEINAGV